MTEQPNEESGPTGFHRRRFLATAGALGAGVFLAGCGKDDKKASPTTTAASGGSGDASTTTGSGGGMSDLKVGAFAASLEVLAVNTYKAALDAATANKLGPVPPAVAEFVKTAQDQHQQVLDEWNGVLQSGNMDQVTSPPKDLESQVNQMFGKVTDVTGAAKLALLLEQIASATYLKALPTLTTEPAIKLAASVQIPSMQRQAILNFVLGNYPVPDTFAKTDKAASPS